jgi:hypothetical protein
MMKKKKSFITLMAAREGGWYRPTYYYGSGEEYGK